MDYSEYESQSKDRNLGSILVALFQGSLVIKFNVPYWTSRGVIIPEI